ncbi:hypothetical protein [Micromonospora sp. WMMD710]|uniref:hypothetical protein n=1 Tax=Micromonospora sp. WMMD710 TaxID=3016085 RepID=UPI0024162AFE|nr:hypothetical protein [Micromonospora sp. WMMD710]MDG4759778.1 hypothetical protein [Micromonospora sp. WMMD710]
MQPESPYRYTHMLGACQVGKAWAAVDGQGQFATVAVLDGVAASDERWRVAFGNAANALAQAAGGHRYADADLTAAHPWVAYGAQEGNAPQRLFQSLGMDYQPVPDQPVSAPPTSAPPTSAPPALPVSGVPQQASGPPQPQTPELVSEMPQLPWAVHMAPVSGQPVSASPQPVSAAPQPVSAAPASPAPQPVSAAPQSAAYANNAPSVPPFDPFSTSGGRRIAPVAPKPKRPNWILIAGALVLALVAGTAGFLIGGSGDDTPAPPVEASLGPFETTQMSINRAKFQGELAPLAEPWLAQAGGCAAYDELGAPKLPADEKRHVFCHFGGAFLHFVVYPATKEKDAARAFRLQLNLAAGALAPGLRQATRTNGNKTGAPGSYLEYAFKLQDGRTMCGIWWDQDDSPGVLYIETLCQDGIAGNWDALRDLWRRGS